MIFRKNRRMIDVRELQRRGVVRIPVSDVQVQTNKQGFVDMGNMKTGGSQAGKPVPSQSNTEFFGFMDSASEAKPSEFRTAINGYDKREVDTKITDLDNKIYKLENRIELLEKKIGVNQSDNSDVGVMGW